MKKISIISTLLILVAILFACNTNTEETTEKTNELSDTSEIQNEEKIVTEEETKVEFNKFEDYASIKTKDDLIAEFGKSNLKDGIAYYAEGTVVYETTTLTNPINKHVIKYVWDDNFKTSSIEAYYSIVDDDFNEISTQIIETNEGLSLGMSLSELREWNGANFKFSGFGWDFGGSIFASQECRITKSPITIYLQSKSNDLPEFAIGDVELNADDKELKNAKIIVSSFDLYIK